MKSKSLEKCEPVFTGPIGENIVMNELLWHGWAPANLNLHIKNAPNVDILAAKGDKKVAIQIKTGGIGSKSMVQLGYYEDGKPIFNSRSGPNADFVIFVRLFGHRDFECYVVPIDIAESTALKDAQIWKKTPKRDGKIRKTFPAAVWFEPNGNRPDESNYREKWAQYRDAWHLLDAKITSC
jgi:hypothetical protein